MPETLPQLIRLFQLLQSSRITDYRYQDGILRLQLENAQIQAIYPEYFCLQLVITGCQNLYYNTYTIKSPERTITNSGVIFSHGLVVQGITGTPPNKLIVYCTSYLNTLEAGELHFLLIPDFRFMLYDQDYGRISFSDLQQQYALSRRI